MKQLIKSASVYKAELPTADALRTHLAEKPFTECQPNEIRSAGFVPVNEDDLVLEFPGGLAFDGQTEFSLTQDFKFKGIGFATTPDGEDDGAYGLAATAALEVSALAAVVTELCTMLAYKEDEADATTDEAGYTRGPVSDGGMDPRETAPHLEGDGPDPMYEQAVVIVREHQRASISLVQRHLRLGYNRAARLLEAMANAGVVAVDSTSGGYKPL